MCLQYLYGTGEKEKMKAKKRQSYRLSGWLSRDNEWNIERKVGKKKIDTLTLERERNKKTTRKQENNNNNKTARKKKKGKQ